MGYADSISFTNVSLIPCEKLTGSANYNIWALASLGNNQNCLRGGSSNSKPRPKCDHCNRLGHTIDRCWKLHDKPPRQVAAWDANLVTPHKRMGNAVVDLQWLCDGDTHEILVELEGMGGGGEVWLEVKYKTFDEIDDEKKWWKIPFVSDFIKKNGFDSAVRKVIGSDTVQVSQFVEYAFGQLKSFNNDKGRMSDNDKYDIESSEQSNESAFMLKTLSLEAGSSEFSSEQRNMEEFRSCDSETGNEHALEPSPQASEEELSNQRFWMNFSNVINANIVQKLRLSVPEKLKWDGLEFLNKIGSQSQDIQKMFIFNLVLRCLEALKNQTIKQVVSLPLRQSRLHFQRSKRQVRY
ncbi:unnamed protein product [Vicia faba]|uniref:Uncharacterized protein n=1 Tax=Vicia faba TaxID=3906 RepID=A0AAV0ZXC0_VICFA|nr:unnamed protein product [Vicia faba]